MFVIEDCSGFLEVCAIASRYGLASKNYIGKWEHYLKKKGLLYPEATKPNKTIGRYSKSIALTPIWRTDYKEPQEYGEFSSVADYNEKLQKAFPNRT